MTIDLLLRIYALTLLTLWRAYWSITAIKAQWSKPKTNRTELTWEKLLIIALGIYIVLAILGVTIWPFQNQALQILGAICLTFGFIESMLGRFFLNDNWAESYNYQIKKNHQLIKQGIYRLVRHPIYGGMYLMALGALLVSQTWTVLPLAILALPALNQLAVREELLLTKHFGQKYRDYQIGTWKFFPYLF